METWGIDYPAFSGHKVYAPFGSGASMVCKGLLRLTPAELELIRSSGEENIERYLAARFGNEYTTYAASVHR